MPTGVILNAMARCLLLLAVLSAPASGLAAPASGCAGQPSPAPPCSAAAGRAAALPDHLGTVRALLDPAGGQVSRFRFGPFGTPLSAEGPDRIGFGHSGKEWFERTGLVYYGQRWYHPESGRWLSRDPAGEEGGLNLYGFCRNDPVNHYDLDGFNRGLTGV